MEVMNEEQKRTIILAAVTGILPIVKQTETIYL